MITKPIHTGTIDGKSIRFFRSPRPGPRFPWHAHSDLAACLAIPEELREYFFRMTADLGNDEIQSVSTAEGIVMIACHSVAQGLMMAALEKNPPTPRNIETLYSLELFQANKAAGDLLTLEEILQAYDNG